MSAEINPPIPSQDLLTDQPTDIDDAFQAAEAGDQEVAGHLYNLAGQISEDPSASTGYRRTTERYSTPVSAEAAQRLLEYKAQRDTSSGEPEASTRPDLKLIHGGNQPSSESEDSAIPVEPEAEDKTVTSPVDNETKTPEPSASSPHNDLSDLIKYGSDGRGRRQDGKFLSNHELEMISANQDIIRAGLPERVSDLVTVDTSNLVHRPNGRFMSQNELNQIVNHQDQIRDGLAELPAPQTQPEEDESGELNPATELDNAFSAFIDRVNGRISDGTALTPSEVMDMVQNMQGLLDKMAESFGYAKDSDKYKQLQTVFGEEVDDQIARLNAHNQDLNDQKGAFEPIGDPNVVVAAPVPKGLRGKLLAAGQNLRDLYRKAGVKAYDMFIGHYGRDWRELNSGEQSRRKQVLGAAAGALTLAAAGLAIYKFGFSGGNGHAKEAALQFPHVGGGAGHHVAREAVASANAETSLHLTHSGDNIWNEVSTYLQGHGYKASNENVAKVTDVVLRQQHLTDLAARHLPVGYGFDLPPREIIEQLIAA